MTQQTKKRGKLKIICYGLLAAILLPAILLWSFSAYVNSLRIPDELRKPPRLARLAGKAAPSTGSKMEPPATAEKPWRKTHYNDLIRQRLERGEQLPAGKLYLELAGLWAKHGISKQFSERFPQPRPGGKSWRSGRDPVSDEQAKWLREQEALLALFRRLLVAGALPASDADNISHFATPDYAMLIQLSQMLAAEGQRRLQEGSAAGAVADFLALAGSGKNLSNDITLFSSLVVSSVRQTGYERLRRMLEEGELSNDLLGTVRKRLQKSVDMDAAVDRFLTGLDWEYRNSRLRLINSLDGSWIRLMRESYRCNTYRDLSSVWSELQRDAGQVLRDARTAIRLKQDAAEYLRAFDACYLSDAESMRQPYSLKDPEELRAFEQMVTDYHYGYALPSHRTIQVLLLREQAERNLLRAGAAWLSDSAAVLDNLLADFTEAPDHPWRDPFTELPLQMRRTNTHVLIYSVGPDLEDQRGETECPDTPGFAGFAPGDIILRLPLPPPAENPAP